MIRLELLLLLVFPGIWMGSSADAPSGPLLLPKQSSSLPYFPFPTSTMPPPLGWCPCPGPTNDTLAANAAHMHDSIRNVTGWLSKAKHRATHSQEAWVASVMVSTLLALVVMGVWATRMWEDQAHIAIQQKQPVRYEMHNPKTDMRVKDMLRSRARSFVRYFDKKRKKRTPGTDVGSSPSSPNRRQQHLEMETFLGGSRGSIQEPPGDEDQVDFVNYHRRLLESSSSEISSTSEDEDDYIYAINQRTGEWGGYGESDTEARVLGGPMSRRDGGSRPPPRTDTVTSRLMDMLPRRTSARKRPTVTQREPLTAETRGLLTLSDSENSGSDPETFVMNRRR